MTFQRLLSRTPFVTIVLVSFLAIGCSSSSENNKISSNQSRSGQKPSKTASADTLPLLTIMVNLEQNMQSISSGLWRHDFDQIDQSAQAIANHAKIPKSQIQTIRKILGEEKFKAFVQDDKTVHRMAVEISEAAGNENFEKTAEIYQKLERGCISCHSKHRSTIRNSPRWN